MGRQDVGGIVNLLTKEIKLKEDIASRQAANFVYEISSIPCNIWIVKGERQINAKSILGLLSLGLTKDDIITIVVDGNEDNLVKVQKCIC